MIEKMNQIGGLIVLVGSIGFLVAMWIALIADSDLSSRYGENEAHDIDDYWW